jgi:hypothetical protein
VPELGTLGSVRGDTSNGVPYRDGRVARASVRLFWVVAQASGTRSQVRSSREGGAVGVNGE